MTGTNAARPASPSVCTELLTRLRSAALISSSVISSPCRYFSRSLSSASLTFSISCSRILERLVHHVGGNLRHDVVGAHRLVLVGDRLHPDEVDDAGELVLGANRQLNRDGIAAELRDDLLEGPLEVRADAVHLVDEADPRDAILVGLAPDGLRLRLDAGDRVEHGDGAVEDAQRPLDFGREVDVPGRVDDVDAVLAPEARRRGGRDRDPALLLLLHPVHDRGAVVHFTDLVRDARVEQDPFSRRGLAGIDVGHDADVPRPTVVFLWHKLELLSASVASRRPSD